MEKTQVKKKAARKKRGLNDVNLIKNLAVVENDDGEIILAGGQKKEPEKVQEVFPRPILINEDDDSGSGPVMPRRRSNLIFD